MKQELLTYDETGFFSKTVTDYLADRDTLKPFYRYKPSVDSIPEVIKNKNFPDATRTKLTEILLRQHEIFRGSPLEAAVIPQIEQLKQAGTFTVTTAHQPNLFLGPLYLIYKVISTINLAHTLNEKFPTFHFVPVFWMGSEDHDEEELNHIYVYGKAFSWQATQSGAFGRMRTDSLQPLLHDLENVLGDGEHAKSAMSLLKECYATGTTIATATKKLLYHFFSADGLVIVDGDDEELKELFLPVMEKELVESPSEKIVALSDASFSKTYATQITPREINLFYLKDDLRSRIVRAGDRWTVLNTTLSFSREELITELHAHPDRFSPNVVLRPLYQEMVLPDVAFIGGGAEVSYFLQLKSLFDFFHVAYPMVLLRNSALWIDSGNASRMQKLHLTEKEIFKPADQLIQSFISRQAGDGIVLEGEKKLMNQIFDNVMEKALVIDSTLKGSVEAEKIKQLKSLELMEDKLRRAAKKREETSLQQIRSLKEKLFPSNGLQERYDNWLMYYAKYGPGFFDSLKSSFNPLDFRFTVLIEKPA